VRTLLAPLGPMQRCGPASTSRAASRSSTGRRGLRASHRRSSRSG
jgi:hypothetical protein